MGNSLGTAERNTKKYNIISTQTIKPMLYGYILPKSPEHEGYIKIGEARTQTVEDRVKQQGREFGLKKEIVWRASEPENTRDNDFRNFLVGNGFNRGNFDGEGGTEWIKITVDELKEQIAKYKGLDDGPEEYFLRTEQEDAVNKTLTYFNSNQQPKTFLWNAKPRFGKTLTSYDLMKKMNAKKVLILTNRPAISDSWFSDYLKYIYQQTDYLFLSSKPITIGRHKSLTREEVRKNHLIEKPFVFFISLQDIKGKDTDINKAKWFKQKNQWLFDDNMKPWDLLIIDESHEGAKTDKAKEVLKSLKVNHTLHLSGTPFKAIANNDFDSDQIYNWTYADEQAIKDNWGQEKDPEGNQKSPEQLVYELEHENPYVQLPKMNVYTYQLSQTLELKAEQALEAENEYAFDLTEFFKISGGEFVYKDEINKFLDNISGGLMAKNGKPYPFATEEYRKQLRHTFWLMPNRVEICKAMKKLLNEHHLFKNYDVILAAGKGDDEMTTKSPLEEVRHQINEDDKPTITLSCGQLTTGVTIPEWTAVLMLNSTESPTQYLQATFRAQNPWVYNIAGTNETKMKTDCFLFDFAPDRVLTILADYASSLIPGNEIHGREEKVKTLLNFLPVLAEDDEGNMKELDAKEVLNIPLKLISREVVERGFMSDRLFDNISRVFGAPAEIREILNKMKVEKNRRIVKGEDVTGKDSQGKEIRVDSEGNAIVEVEDVEKVINEQVDEKGRHLLGKKKYVVEGSEQAIITEKEIKKIENSNLTEAEKSKKLDELPQIFSKEELEEKAEDEAKKEKNKEKKSEEDKVRDHLRAFSRTIPMILMAYGDSYGEYPTIKNIDHRIPDDEFEELTSITKNDFRKLRDGYDYVDEQGNEKKFEGLFRADVFNSAIIEFMDIKLRLAQFFDMKTGKDNSREDIFDYIPPQETNQIFTPKKVVKQMIDLLEKDQPGIFKDPNKTFIDLYMKSGLYIAEIVRRLYIGLKDKISNDEERLIHIFTKQVYGLAPTDILYNICTEFLLGWTKKDNIFSASDRAKMKEHFKQLDLVKVFKNNEDPMDALRKAFNMKGDEMIKFDAVVGNPPYEYKTGQTAKQTQGNSNWIYYHFQNIADKIGRYTSLIYPFGGWFDDPKAFQGFGKKILSDEHTISITAYEGTSDKRAWYRTDRQPQPIFSNSVNLSAGVSIVFRDLKQKHKTYKYFNRVYSDKTRSINAKDWEFLTPSTEFAFAHKLTGPKLIKRLEKGTFGIESNFVELNPTKVSLNKADWGDPIILYTNDKSGSSGRAKMFWTDRSLITKNTDLINEYKVVTTSAYPKQKFSSGKPTIENVKKRLSELIEILPIGSAFGRSRMMLFHSQNKTECNNFLKYTQTNFFAYLVLQEPNRSSSFGFVIPDQDFTANSDIDWSKSIPEIDQQLYKKYNLSKEEIAFIEKMVKPMGE